MHRILVIGCSCSGKTTLAKKLSRRLGVEHIEIDRINWQPNWQHLSSDELRTALAKATEAERWIVDGNYSTVRDIVWPRATHAVWLNYSFVRVSYRALKRTITRVVTREELFAGNTESFVQSFLSRDSILVWVLKTFWKYRRQYRRYREERTFPNLEWTELHSPSETDRFVENLPRG